MNERNLVIIGGILWNVCLVILSGFCCWYFKSIFGLIPLLGVKEFNLK